MSEENTNLRNGRQPRTRDELSGALRYAYDELTHLKSENDNFKTVMIAAAEEIQAHWQAHCDEEGYGPANLMLRLEKGIPAQYGYTAGAFTKMEEELSRLKADCKTLEEHKEGLAGDLMKAWKENDRFKAENEELIAGIRRSQHLCENLKWDDGTAEGLTANQKANIELRKEVKRLKAEREKVIEHLTRIVGPRMLVAEHAIIIEVLGILNHKD